MWIVFKKDKQLTDAASARGEEQWYFENSNPLNSKNSISLFNSRSAARKFIKFLGLKDYTVRKAEIVVY